MIDLLASSLSGNCKNCSLNILKGGKKIGEIVNPGEYFGDVTSYEAIAEKIQNVTSNYFVLGYYIDEKWDGKYHDGLRSRGTEPIDRGYRGRRCVTARRRDGWYGNARGASALVLWYT